MDREHPIKLSKQQVAVLEHYMDGHDLPDVAKKFGVSYSRIRNIIDMILIKTGCQNKIELLVNSKEILEMQDDLKEKRRGRQANLV